MRSVRGVLRVFRSVVMGALMVLPVILGVLLYENRDYLNRDGLLLVLASMLRSEPAEPAEAPPPEDWGHETIPPPDPDILAIARLLRAGDHAGLAALAERDREAFARFQDSSPDLAEHLDAWMAAEPQAALPRLLRGRYWYQIGWHQRGHAYFNATSRKQLERMRAAFARARTDFEAAIAIDPADPAPYPPLLRLHLANGQHALRRAVWERALAAGATGTGLYRAQFTALLPWWSDLGPEESADAIRAIVERIESGTLRGTVDPEPLRAYPDYVLAETFLRTGRVEAGLAKYRTFIDGPEGRLFRARYAGRLRAVGRPAEALEPYVRALRNDPSRASVLRDYGAALRRLGLNAEAEEALDRALALDPYDPRARLQRARLNVALDRVEAALADVDAAEHYGAERESVLRGAGRIRVRLAQDLAAAAAEYRAATEAEPDRAENHYFLGALLDRMRDCGAVPAYRAYVEMCRDGAECIPGTVARSGVRWRSLVDRYICSIDGHRLEPEPAWVAVPLE